MACLEDIKKAAAGILDDNEVEAIYSALQKIRRQKRGSPRDINREMLEEAERMIETWVQAAKIEKRNRGFNVLAEARALEALDNYKTRKKGADDFEALVAYLVGVGGGDSVASRMLAKERGIMGGVISKITEADLWSSLNSRALDLDIAREMWELGRAPGEGKPGVSGNADARRLAEIFHDAQRAVVQMQNDAGAWIDPLPGYIVRQTHDAVRIRRHGGENGEIWIRDLRDNDWIDWDTTAPGLSEAEKLDFLLKVHKNLSDGIHYKANGEQHGDKFFAFKGPANIAKKISSERVLHFKTADAWFAYNEKYGSANLSEALFYGIERGARNAALMEGLGTNPEAMIQRIKERLIERNRGDQKVLQKLEGRRWFDTLSWYVDELTGANKIPGSVKGAMISSGIRAFQSFGKLGGAFLSSINDMATMASQAKFNGLGLLDSYGESFQNLMRGRGTAEQRELADLIGVGFEGMIGQVLSRWGAQDHVPGRLNSLVQMTFKYTGLNWWTDAHKTGFTAMLSRNLAIHRSKAWADLPEDLRFALGLYVKPEQWDVIRGLETRTADGVEYVTPKAAQEMTDAQVRAIIGEKASDWKVRRYRDDLETSIRNYFVDQADSAIPTPGAREMAILRGSEGPGTVGGEARRFIAQFKAFPVTFMTKGLGKFYMNGQANVAGIAQLVIMSTIMGYIAMTAKDIAKNRTPRDITKQPLKVFLAAMQQGGGLGIYGDFLFGEGSRFGHSALETMLGPSFTTLADIWNLKSSGIEAIASDKEFKFSNKLLNLARSNAPIVNWWWTKAAFDMAIFNNIQEHINPGYLDRARARMQKFNEQDFLINPQ